MYDSTIPLIVALNGGFPKVQQLLDIVLLLCLFIQPNMYCMLACTRYTYTYNCLLYSVFIQPIGITSDYISLLKKSHLISTFY